MAVTEKKPQVNYGRLARQIREFFYHQDNPPTDQLIVDKVKPHWDREENANVYTAVVVYVGHYPTKKEHVVNIEYLLDRNGNFDPRSYNYV